MVAFGQTHTKRALFLGNSYTAANNLPHMVADVALSAGDTLFFDSNTPGGYTLEGHSTNETSLNKIKSGDWDFVVLQEQSQLPSLPIAQVIEDVFPYARILDSIINEFNPCCETVFYMTWGRKNGDVSNCDIWPPVCTYEGMDSLLNLRYRMMADSNDAILSPVGAVWHHIREHYPEIELYSADESHPSVAGTYAAACCFYSSLFRKDPEIISFNPSLPPAESAHIRTAAREMVFDSLMNWHIGEYDPVSGFSYAENENLQVAFLNSSENASEYLWEFGDGETSITTDPVHDYASPGVYNVKLKASHCLVQDSIIQTVNVGLSDINEPIYQNSTWTITPVPANEFLNINHNYSGTLNFAIADQVGRIVKSGTIDDPETQVVISTLPAGLYILQLFDSVTSLGQRKFIIVR